MSTGEPRGVGTIRRNRDLLESLCSRRRARKAKEAVKETKKGSREEGEAAALLRGFFSALAPRDTKPDLPCPEKEAASISRVVASIDQAVKASALTEEEGGAVIDFLVSRFVERRVNDTLRHLAAPRHDSWFMTACESSPD